MTDRLAAPAGPGSGAVGGRGLDLAVRVGLGDLLALDGARRVGLALTEGGGRRLHFTASDRPSDRDVVWCHIDAFDDVPLTTAVRTGRAVQGGLDELDPRYAGLVERQREAGTTALAALPLPGPGSAPMGGVVVFLSGPAGVDDALAADLADRAGRLAEVVAGARVLSPRPEVPLADHPVAAGARVADAVLGADHRAPGDARRFLRPRLESWGLPEVVVESAVLCVSELVTNAVVHTGSPSELRVVLDEGQLTVTVRDRGAQTAVVRPAPGDRLDAMRVHGRGLGLVGAITEAWGTELDATGTTVWFHLPVGSPRADTGAVGGGT